MVDSNITASVSIERVNFFSKTLSNTIVFNNHQTSHRTYNTSDDGHKNHDWSFSTITNKDSYDLLVNQCNRYNIPTALHVYNSSVPSCQSFLSEFESFAKHHDLVKEVRIQYAKMDYTPETSFMFKFAPNQLPITVVMFGQRWARTVTGPRIGEIERLVMEVVREYQTIGGSLPDD
jgi:hypothetical protein